MLKCVRIAHLAFVITTAAGVVTLRAAQSPRQVDLVIANGIVVTGDAQRPVVERGSVATDGNSIAAVGPADQIAKEFRGRTTIDAAGRVVMPGLINTHT